MAGSHPRCPILSFPMKLTVHEYVCLQLWCCDDETNVTCCLMCADLSGGWGWGGCHLFAFCLCETAGMSREPGVEMAGVAGGIVVMMWAVEEWVTVSSPA